MRVFGVEAGAPKVSEIQDWAESAGGSVGCDEEAVSNLWQTIEVVDENDDVVAVLTRDLVDTEDQDSVGADDIKNFIENLDDASPRSAAEWVQRYLGRCTVVYCFQILNAINSANGWDVVRELMSALRDYCGGISHAEGEGFSNEEGYQITWEFMDETKGDWAMAVRDGGQWLKFRMDLGDGSHRDAFKAGRCPEGAVLIEE